MIMDENVTDNTAAKETVCNCENAPADGMVKELESLKAELEEKNKKNEEYLDKLQRSAAEFDNYKKRTLRE